MFHKGEKERQLAYSNQVISDENGWVLASQVFPGNLHDSQTGLETVINYIEAHEEVDMAVMDSGYNHPMYYILQNIDSSILNSMIIMFVQTKKY